MREVYKVNHLPANLFIEYDEVKIFWDHIKKYGTKWRTIAALCIFRGLRIGEVLAIQLWDFNEEYDKLNIILEKSNIYDEIPIMREITSLIKYYIENNMHTFKDGYIFPRNNGKGKHLDSETAGAWMSKVRQEIGKQYPQFLDRKMIKTISEDYDELRSRYRIGWHSLRRFFETTLLDSGYDVETVARIMRYRDVNTVYIYANPYRIWRKEREILHKGFGALHIDLMNANEGQLSLDSFT